MIGKEILNYRITGIIGQGGMGTVYLGVNKFIQEQKVAIKVINHDMLNDFTRQRLEEEAHRLASLNHPNIVHLVNFHKDEKGSVYLIMEYAEGVSIEKYLHEVNGLVVEDRICPLFEPILDGIGCAHKHKNSKGENDPIIHCDIKPANIVITPDKEPKIKILDFGIAQIVSEQEGQARFVMGTPSYMSPEQVKGEHLDARSDIYSLGVLLHQMLTGNAPYDTTTLTEQQINQKVVEEPLPRMATYYKYVSEKVQKIVDKATAKNPDDRYQTCEEFKKALHRAIYPPKMPLWAKIAAAAVVALIVGVGTYVWDYNRIKTYYYKDYTEQWGIPQGIGELSSSEHSHSHRSYRFTYQKRKLLRVSHVNSFDNLIDDGESERNERPVDQEFFYTENGNVSRIKVKDRSGKVLYVKSYNDKLNVMAFQYDDEHNTERVLSNSTVGYGRLLESNDNERGRISRWWIEYDENGYTTSEKYYSLDNSPVGDANGIYGRTYVRDEKGRPIEIHYIGIDGKPQSTKWGLGIKKFEYDSDDNWIKATYLTIDGKTAYDDTDGVAIFTMEYDKYGNVINAYHLNGDGKPMLPKKNYVSGVHYTYDDKGLIVQDDYLDVEHKPMYVRGMGVAIVKSEYDENGYVIKKTFCDPSGNITDSKEGNAIAEYLNDEHGNAIESWFKNSKGELCELSNGYAGVKQEYDSVGNLTKLVYYGIDKKPALDKDGCAGYTLVFNDQNLLTEYTNLGKDLRPAADKNGIILARYAYDKRGNITRSSFYEADGKTLRLSNEGVAGWDNVYDEKGNHIERRFFDTKEKPVMSSVLHYAKVKYTYDDNGNLNTVRYQNVQGGLTLVNGLAGYDYINDKRGNTIEEKPIGTNGGLAINRLIIKYKYDAFDNCTEQSVYNNSGAATNSTNVHRNEYVYNSRNQLVETRHYGTDGKLTICHDNTNCAIQKNEYDDKGDRIKTSYLGTDNKPCKCDEGWSSATYEYDVFGNVIKQCFFGVDGKPTDPKDMVPVGIAKYDKWGNLIYVAGQDDKGKFIVNPNTGWAIARYEFDDRNNRISESYFDASDKPTKGKEGYHKAAYKYDNLDRQIEISYYGENGEAILYLGFHKQKLTYEESTNNVKEVACFDKNDKATNCDAGFHKRVTTYDSLGVATNRKYYAANGELLSNQVWNGEDWVVIRNWQDDAKRLAREFPQTMGPVTVTALRITGSNSCDLIIKMSYTRIELDESDFENLKAAVKELTKRIEEYLDHKPYVTGKLYDKNNNLVYEVKV